MTRRRKEFVATSASLGQARDFARQVLSPRESEAVCDDMVLALSELATNAIMHAQSPFEVAIETNGTVRLEVTDRSAELPQPRQPSPDREGGRGLSIIEQICDRWGTIRGASGKCVWCERDR